LDVERETRKHDFLISSSMSFNITKKRGRAPIFKIQIVYCAMFIIALSEISKWVPSWLYHFFNGYKNKNKMGMDLGVSYGPTSAHEMLCPGPTELANLKYFISKL
jgi:hypothetical protein